MADSVLLSVVVAAYTTERLKDIRDILESLRAQTYRNIEVVFVVDGSAPLLEIMQKMGSEMPGLSLQIVFNDGDRGLSNARNLGVKASGGDIIAFLDDDAVAYPDWAEQMVKTYRETAIIGVTGPAMPVWEDEGMSWCPEDLDWIVGGTRWFSAKEICDVRNVWGMNMSFRRQVFDRGISFSPAFGLRGGTGAVAEETDISLRIKKDVGGRIVYNPQVKVGHKVYKYRLSWGFIWRRSYEIGRSRRLIARVHGASGPGENLLKREQRLLRTTVSRMFGDAAKIFTDPLMAWRRFSVTCVALSSVALGYLSGILSPLDQGPVLKEVASHE